MNVLVEVGIQRHEFRSHADHPVRVNCAVVASELREDKVVLVSFLFHVLKGGGGGKKGECVMVDIPISFVCCPSKCNLHLNKHVVNQFVD